MTFKFCVGESCGCTPIDPPCCCFIEAKITIQTQYETKIHTLPLTMNSVGTPETELVCTYQTSYSVVCTGNTNDLSSPGYFDVLKVAEVDLPRSPAYYTSFGGFGYKYTGSERWRHNIIFEKVWFEVRRTPTGLYHNVWLNVRDELYRFPTPGSYAEYLFPYAGCTGETVYFTTDIPNLACEAINAGNNRLCVSTLSLPASPSSFYRVTRRWQQRKNLTPIPVDGVCSDVLAAINETELYLPEYQSGDCLGMPIAVSDPSTGIPAQCVGTSTNSPEYTFASVIDSQLVKVTFELTPC